MQIAAAQLHVNSIPRACCMTGSRQKAAKPEPFHERPARNVPTCLQQLLFDISVVTYFPAQSVMFMLMSISNPASMLA